jgi:uncharacterized protein
LWLPRAVGATSPPDSAQSPIALWGVALTRVLGVAVVGLAWDCALVHFAAPPPTAAWQHRQVRLGFEVVYFDQHNWGCHVHGSTAAVEDGLTWVVEYQIDLDSSWTTRHAEITGRSAAGLGRVLLEADGCGHWKIDGKPAPHLDGCLDVDLESSAMTNALPVHRMALVIGQRAAAPAAYVRAVGFAVERLEQIYVRAADEGDQQRYDYTAPLFDFGCRLVYDQTGLVLDYPGIAVRAG